MFQQLLRNWLFNAARQRAAEAVREGSRQQGPSPADAAETRQPLKPERCDIGLVFALGMEASGLAQRMSGVIRISGAGFVGREGGIEGRRVVAIEAGAGRKAAEHGARALIAGHRPKWIISAGFAGGLDPRLELGDIVMANAVADLEGRELAIDINVDAQALAETPRLHIGRLITVDRVIREAKEKTRLGAERQAIAVDMESMAVAEVCRQEKVRFMVVRVISDSVARELPRDIDYLVKRRTTAGRLGAAARAVLRRPSSVRDMWQLKEDALRASDRLGSFLVGVIGQLE